jgi:hypothetical protein
LFHSGTSRPVNHAEDGSTRRCSVGPKTVHCRDSWSRPLWPVALWRTVHGLPLHGARECDIPNTGFNRLRCRRHAGHRVLGRRRASSRATATAGDGTADRSVAGRLVKRRLTARECVFRLSTADGEKL